MLFSLITCSTNDIHDLLLLFSACIFCFHSVHKLSSDCLIVLGTNSMKPYLFLHLLVMGMLQALLV